MSIPTWSEYAARLDATDKHVIDRAREVVPDFGSMAGCIPPAALARVAALYLDVAHEQHGLERPWHPFRFNWRADA